MCSAWRCWRDHRGHFTGPISNDLFNELSLGYRDRDGFMKRAKRQMARQRLDQGYAGPANSIRTWN